MRSNDQVERPPDRPSKAARAHTVTLRSRRLPSHPSRSAPTQVRCRPDRSPWELESGRRKSECHDKRYAPAINPGIRPPPYSSGGRLSRSVERSSGRIERRHPSRTERRDSAPSRRNGPSRCGQLSPCDVSGLPAHHFILAMPQRDLTIKLSGRPEDPTRRRGRILYDCVRAAYHLTCHGPLQRKLGLAKTEAAGSSSSRGATRSLSARPALIPLTMAHVPLR